jgi:hypothetical protein
VVAGRYSRCFYRRHEEDGEVGRHPGGGGQPQVLADAEVSFWEAPAWSPDGRQIAFTTPQDQLAVVPTSGGAGADFDERDYGTVVRLARPVQDARAATQPPGYVLLDLPLQELLPEHSSADVDLLLLERDGAQVLYGPEGVERGKELAEVLPDLARAFGVAARDSSGTVTFAHQEEEHLAAYVDMH